MSTLIERLNQRIAGRLNWIAHKQMLLDRPEDSALREHARGFIADYERENEFDRELVAALSVAPAPVAAIPSQTRDLLLQKALTYKSDGEYRIAEALEDVAEEVYRAPPVQEGPKGIEELPRGLVEDWEAEAEREGVMDTEYVAQKAVEWARQRSPAQSIPAAIDEEGREAVEAGIRALFVADDLPLDEQAKHAAALKRLLAGN